MCWENGRANERTANAYPASGSESIYNNNNEKEKQLSEKQQSSMLITILLFYAWEIDGNEIHFIYHLLRAARSASATRKSGRYLHTVDFPFRMVSIRITKKAVFLLLCCFWLGICANCWRKLIISMWFGARHLSSYWLHAEQNIII